MKFLNENSDILLFLITLLIGALGWWLFWYFTDTIEPWVGGENKRWKLTRDQIKERRHTADIMKDSLMDYEGEDDDA